MGIDRVLETIGQAIEIENYGYGFYNGMRAYVDDRKALSVISDLAEMELEHMKWLEEEYKRILRTADELDETEVLPISMTAKGEIFLDNIKLKDIFRDFDAVKALRFAIDIERRSVDFYKRNREIVDDDRTMDLFTRLADFELDHITLLAENLKNLESTGSWTYE